MAQDNTLENGQSEWEYRGVRLQMTAVAEDEKQIFDYKSPSIADGLTTDQEYDLRIAGCELIQLSGQLLKLPQVAMATGQVLFQRFFYNKSLVRHDYEHYAMGCIHLAAKIEECPRRLRDTINVFHHMRQAREQKPFMPLIPDQSYVNLKNQVIKAERRVLKELGFCVHVKHPHKLIICYLQFLGEEKNSNLVQCAWNFMNDSLRTTVFVCYYPETIACACIYLAARQLKIPLPESSTQEDCWWNVFQVKESSIRAICYEILRLYSRDKPKTSELEAKLADLHEQRRQHLEKRQRQREVAATLSAVSVASASASGSATHGQLRTGAISDALMTAASTLATSESGSGANTGGGGARQSSNEERHRHRSHERNRKHRSKRIHRDRRNKSRSRSRTPKAYRRGISRSRSRTPPRRSNKDKHGRNHTRRHRVRSLSSASPSPSSDRHHRSSRLKKSSSGLTRRHRSRSNTRSRSRSPIGRTSANGSRKSGNNNYYTSLSSAVNGRTKIRRN